jgi:hypothetical protein
LNRCVASLAECQAQNTAAACSLATCPADIPAIPLQFYANHHVTSHVTISYDAVGIPKTQLEILPGTFDPQYTIVDIKPVTLYNWMQYVKEPDDPASPVVTAFGVDLQEGVVPIDEVFTYSDIVLSTPFQCNASAAFELGIVVHAAIDTTLYVLDTSSTTELNTDTSGTADGTTVVLPSVTVPCELQANHIWYTVDTPNGELCVGNLNLDSTSATVLFEPGNDYVDESTVCAALGVYPNGVLQSVENYIAWSTTEESQNCLCFTDVVDPLTGENRPDVCSLYSRYRETITVTAFENTTLAAQSCPPSGAVADIFSLTLIREDGATDVCALEEYAIEAGVVRIEEVCLGYLDTDQTPPVWICVYDKPTREANPTWDGTGPRARVKSVLPACEPDKAYAFLRMPLGDDVVPIEKTPTFLELWWEEIVIASSVTLFVFAFSSYVIWRFRRYRKKYKAEKEQTEFLQQRRINLDRNAGGLGVHDEEVVMKANPLVVEMNSMADQLKKVNDLFDIKEKRDRMEMESIEKERETMVAEINRIKKLLHEATMKKKITRAAAVEDEPLMGGYGTATSGGVGAASADTGFTNMRRMESSSDDEQHFSDSD